MAGGMTNAVPMGGGLEVILDQTLSTAWGFNTAPATVQLSSPARFGLVGDMVLVPGGEVLYKSNPNASFQASLSADGKTLTYGSSYQGVIVEARVILLS